MTWAGALATCALMMPGILWAPRPAGPPPSPRRGVVLDSATEKAISGVQIEVSERTYNPPDCIPTKTTWAVTDALGSYTLWLNCRANLRYAKRGYVSRLLVWPDDLADGKQSVTSMMHPVRLVRVQKRK